MGCIGERACDSATLICPEDNACIVDCQSTCTDDDFSCGQPSCLDMVVSWPTDPALSSLMCANAEFGPSCLGVNQPPSSAQEQMAFVDVLSPVALRSHFESQSLVLIGAFVVLIALVAVFYVRGQKEKAVAASWDDEE